MFLQQCCLYDVHVGQMEACDTRRPANPVLTGARIWALWILYFALLPIRLCTGIVALVAGANGLHFKHGIPGHRSSVKQVARMTSSGSPLGTLGLTRVKRAVAVPSGASDKLLMFHSLRSRRRPVNTFSGYNSCFELLEDTACLGVVPAMQTIEILA